MKFQDTIKPKSDQLNADDFLGTESMTITVTKVTVTGTQDQPVSINYVGDNGKPWKPCKTMRKLIAHAWGTDELQFVGRSIKLYRDPNVTWAGEQVGGIRIKAMTHIDDRIRVALQTSKTKRVIFVIEKLEVKESLPGEDDSKREKAELFTNSILAKLEAGEKLEDLDEKTHKALDRLNEAYPDLYAKVKGDIK